MKRLLATTVVALGISTPAMADLVQVQSPHGVKETIDRLEAAVKNAGATIFARVDHAKGAESVDMELEPATLLIFGNPRLGTPALQESATMGLDLPLRVLAYQDGDTVWVAYHDPVDTAADHGIPSDHASVGAMTNALGNLTGAATAE